MDEFVSKTLKQLGKDFFLTEFNVVNPTNNVVDFELFNSNSLIPTPSSNLNTPQPPTNLSSNILSGTALDPLTNPYYAFNTVNNTLYFLVGGVSPNVIQVYSLNTSTIVSTITLAPTVSIDYTIMYNPNNNRIYAIGFDFSLPPLNNMRVYVIDCNTNALITNITIPNYFQNGGSQNGIYNSTNNSIYFVAGNQVSNDIRLMCFSCATNTLTSTTILNPTTNSFGGNMTYCPSNNSVYISDNQSDLLYVVNCTTNLLTSTITYPIGQSPISSAFNSQSNKIYLIYNPLSLLLDVININTNIVENTITIGGSGFAFTSYSSISYNPIFNLMYISDSGTNNIIILECNTNTTVNTIPITQPFDILYNPLTQSNFIIANVFTPTSGLYINSSPASLPNAYITGTPTYSYNQFNEDKKYQPFLLYCMMMYSSNPKNLNQVFDAQVKDANGQIAKDPKFPALQISMYQFQGSVAKVCFGKKGRGGFILDQESSFTNFTVQPQSSVTLVLIQKQLKLGKNFSKPITLCQKLDPSVNPKLKIAPPKKKELPKGKPKPKDKKPLASKPIKSFFQEICSRMDGEQEVLQDSVNNAMSNFQLKINNSEVEEDKIVNLGVPLVIIGGIVVAFALTK
jgi:YVTN family beta-propeller protein